MSNAASKQTARAQITRRSRSLARLRTSVGLFGFIAILGGCQTLHASNTMDACEQAISQIDSAAEKSLDQGGAGMVVLVGRNGRPVISRAYGFSNLEHGVPTTPETVFRIASVSKQFTAAAILLLMEDGRLDLDDPLSLYVPELPQANEITLYHLLVQTSGLPDYADDKTSNATMSVARSSDEMIQWIASLEPRQLFKPGERWSYSNSNYALLGAVIERVGGKPIQDFFEERLFTPAGMEHTGFDDPSEIVPSRAAGYRRSAGTSSGFSNADLLSWTIPGAAGGLRSTAGDLLIWNNALFSGQLISQASLGAMIAPGKLSDGQTTKRGMPEAWQLGLDADYGMGVFISNSAGGPRIWHSGDMPGFSSWMAHYPEQDAVIALLRNSESADMDSGAIENAAFTFISSDCPARF